MQPKIEKIRGDVSRLTHLAHTVVYVDESGNVKSSFTNPDPMISVIAVIGPVEIEGKKYKQALWTEIGIGRGVPYKQCGYRVEGKHVRTNGRTRVKTLSIEEEAVLLPTLLSLMQSITDDATKNWQSGTGWYKSGKKDENLSLMWKHFTVPTDLPYTCWSILENDFKKRMSGHVGEFIAITQIELGRLKSATYSDKRLKKLKAAQERAAILAEANYSHLVLEHIKRRLGKPTQKERHLFDRILEVFDIEPSQDKDVRLAELRNQFAQSKPPSLPIYVATFDKHRESRLKKEKSYPKGFASYIHGGEHVRFRVQVSKHLARYRAPPPSPPES